MKQNPISIRAGKLEFLKENATRWESRDAYHWLLTLSWPQFIAFLAGCYLLVNLLFACCYAASGSCIAEARSGSFGDDFFFSVETLATVGYGHMYPATLYGHLVTTAEIMVGMFGLAVVTGLIFVRFSRPSAMIVFTRSLVITPFNGIPTLMMRVANLRHQPMVEAVFRIMLLRNECVPEEGEVRRFYELSLDPAGIIFFPAVLTLRHRIDERSPLFGLTQDDLKASGARFFASLVCIDTVMQIPVHSQQDYSWQDVKFGERFAEIYRDLAVGKVAVDYGRIHDTEPSL